MSMPIMSILFLTIIVFLSSVLNAQNIINENTIFEHFLQTAILRNRESGRNGFIFPFTKWCGPGNTAQHFDDLGPDTGTDVCCRDHDHCEHGINTGHEMCQFKNNGFKISSCDCDEKFKECLRSQNSVSARLVLEIYRQFVRKCLNVDPITGECEVTNRLF